MKTSFDKIMDPEYIGDYMQEYRKAGFLQTGSLQDALDNQKKMTEGDIIGIDLRNNKFFQFICLINAEDPDNIAFRAFLFKAFSSRGTEISKDDYLKIETCLNELSPELKPYINDFVIIFNYAKHYCFKAEHIRNKSNKVIDEKLEMDIQNFFASLYPKSNSLEIKQIDIKYTRGGGKLKTLTINSSILMKMMLFEFCKKYYTFIKSADDENWESWIDVHYKRLKKGIKEFAYKKPLKALMPIAWLYLEEEKICINKGLEYYYLIMGKLFTLCGYLPYNESNSKATYENEKEYFAKNLRKYWHPKELK